MVPLAVSIGAVATPLLLVTAVAVADPLKRALAPLVGAVKVTVTPAIGLLLASRTVACRAVAKVLLTAALCGVPAVAAMVLVVAALSATALMLTLAPRPL